MYKNSYSIFHMLEYNYITETSLCKICKKTKVRVWIENKGFSERDTHTIVYFTSLLWCDKCVGERDFFIFFINMYINCCVCSSSVTLLCNAVCVLS